MNIKTTIIIISFFTILNQNCLDYENTEQYQDVEDYEQQDIEGSEQNEFDKLYKAELYVENILTTGINLFKFNETESRREAIQYIISLLEINLGKEFKNFNYNEQKLAQKLVIFLKNKHEKNL